MSSLPRTYPRVDVEVTQADIDGAIRGDSAHCVIADALRRQGFKRVEVDLQVVTFTDEKRGVRVSFLTPEICQMHLISFDQAFPVEPFDFYLRTPVRIRRAGRGSGATSTTKTRDREERKAELEAREASGEATKAERRALTTMRATDEAAAQQRPQESTRMEQSNSKSERLVQVGGKRNVAPPAVLSNAKGRRRYYGARLAKPGVAATSTD